MSDRSPTLPLLDRLRRDDPLVAVELRPPRSGLSRMQSMDLWIDMYHSLRRLASHDTIIFLTDNAVGQAEEENLYHLTTNLAGEITPAKLVPFLTSKHSIEYCNMYATRAASHGFEAVTVLGGDKSVGPPRCVPHAYELRGLLRERIPSLGLGGWVNPHKDATQQVGFLMREDFGADFYLTQIVSHHSIRAVERFLGEAARQNVPYPGVFGVFLYRSANAKTLERLNEFFPVPAEGITRDFASGMSAEDICAKTVRELRALGATKVYLSNLGLRRADERYRRILASVGSS